MSLYLHIHSWRCTLAHIPISPLSLRLYTRTVTFFPYLQNTQIHTAVFPFTLLLHTHTRIYTHTHAPCPLFGPEGYTERYALGSCSLISSSHTHSGSAITSGGPVRHECYPVDNNHSGGRGRDPIPYLLTAPHPPPGAQVALKKLVRYK